MIVAENICRYFKVLNRREGLWGTAKDLFSRDYRIIKAVDDISFTINKGELVGLMGPNGAGKSTTIKMLIGVLKPTSGRLFIDNFDPFKDKHSFIKRIGVVFGQRSQLWWDLPVIESFKLLKEIYEIDDEIYKENISIFNELCNIDKHFLVPVRNLSLGQRMLFEILSAFLHRPQVVFLDEPTIGLDPVIKSNIRDIIKSLNRDYGTTVILTSHDIGDVEELCQRILLVDKGKLLFDGGAKSFQNLFGSSKNLKVRIANIGPESAHNGQGLFDDLRRNFCAVVQREENGWINIEFDEGKFGLMNILDNIRQSYEVTDMLVENVKMETVVKKIYVGSQI